MSRRHFVSGSTLLVLAALGAWCAPTRAETPSLTFRSIEPSSVVRFRVTDGERAVPDRFRLDDHEFGATSKVLKTVGAVRSYDVTLPSPVRTGFAKNDVVHGRYFQPAGEGPFPACVLLHELDGNLWLVHFVSDMLARRGVATLAIAMPFYGERRDEKSSRRMISFDPDWTVASVRQAVLDTRRSAAWMAGRPEIDADRIGVAGISLGGFVASVAAAAEPRFCRAAIVLAGGGVADLIWEHENPVAEGFRKHWKSRGGTRASLVEALKPVEPTTHAQRLDKRPVLMIAAKDDEIVPRKSTMSLVEALPQKPEIVWLDAGHITAIFHLRLEIDRLSGFLSAEPN